MLRLVLLFCLVCSLASGMNYPVYLCLNELGQPVDCLQYGFSGLPAYTQSCVSGFANRTITCMPGYFAMAPNDPSITLKSGQLFDGCRGI
jgi:hypothetical protein